MIEAGCVLIVDNDDAVREALSLLMQSGGMACRTYVSGDDFLAKEPPPGPACILLDLHMPGLSGLEVQAELQARGSDIPIIFLTGHGDVPASVQALKGGAIDFLEKPTFEHTELLNCVRNALDRHRVYLAAQRQDEQFRRHVALLSPRELEVAKLAAAGQANKVIAIELSISERTVEVHRGRAMKKLGFRTIAELARSEHKLRECTNIDCRQ